jgi:hypothetical protein
MKIRFLALLMFWTHILFSQIYLKPEENKLKLGGLPESPILESISNQKAKEVFDIIKNESIEYRYINGSCEDRAHFISMILEKNKIKVGKIWAFAPSKYSLISKKMIEIKDPYNINDTVKWGYHVAPILIVESDSVVIDLSFNNKNYIRKKEWLDKLNTPEAIYFYSKTKDYLFNTLGGLRVWDNNLNPAPSYVIPKFIPDIISGDFWSLFPDNDYVYKGLAINDLALKIYNLSKTNINTEDKNYLIKIVTSIDSIQNEIANKDSNNNLSDETFEQLKKYYSNRFIHWKSRYDEYKN